MAVLKIEVRLLRPARFAQELGLVAGDYAILEIDELNVRGPAYVTYLGAAKALEPGARCPATGLIRHTSDETMRITLADGKALTLTKHHRLHSADRGAWVAAGDLRTGERLSTQQGVVGIAAISTTMRAAEEVFNLEVWSEHYYYVGEAGIWAHNGYGKFSSGKAPHVADVIVYRDGHPTSATRIQSGSMTAEEASLGFPQSSLATHTESRAVRNTQLQPGDTMIIEGEYAPCNSCKGAMNKAHKATGAQIFYTWGEKIWQATGGR